MRIVPAPPFVFVLTSPPMESRPVIVQFEPASSTVAVPVEPASRPIKALRLETLPPAMISRVASPSTPTVKSPELIQRELASLTVTVPWPAKCSSAILPLTL
jgi:hypothetical protein